MIPLHIREKSCRNCLYFETFRKRDDEPSNMGCQEPNWAGYVIDPHQQPCGGVAFFDTVETMIEESEIMLAPLIRIR